MFIAALYLVSRDYLIVVFNLALAAAFAIFALDNLVWPGRRPTVVKVLLGAIVAVVVIVGIVALDLFERFL